MRLEGGTLVLALLIRLSTCEFEDKVLLSNVQVLQFKLGVLTTARRTDPVDQLMCIPVQPVGCPSDAQLQSAICRNMGVDDYDKTLWKCQAEIPEAYAFSMVSLR